MNRHGELNAPAMRRRPTLPLNVRNSCPLDKLIGE